MSHLIGLLGYSNLVKVYTEFKTWCYRLCIKYSAWELHIWLLSLINFITIITYYYELQNWGGIFCKYILVKPSANWQHLILAFISTVLKPNLSFPGLCFFSFFPPLWRTLFKNCFYTVLFNGFYLQGFFYWNIPNIQVELYRLSTYNL